MAPMRVTVPSSTCGSSASCWALLKRWISSTNRTLRRASRVRRSCASAIVARTSATPDMTADTERKSAPTASASRRARDVLPVPGGPQSRSDDRWPRATERRRGPRSPTIVDWPTNSSRVRGRIRAARGCRSGGGRNRASGRAPETERRGGMGAMVALPTGRDRGSPRIGQASVAGTGSAVKNRRDAGVSRTGRPYRTSMTIQSANRMPSSSVAMRTMSFTSRAT